MGERKEVKVVKDDVVSIVTSEVVEQVLETINENVYKIYLYGSYARGDYSVESDIDIMIILNCNRDSVKQYRKIICKLASRIGLKNDIEVSLLLRDRKSFEEGQAVLPFYRNVVGEGVELYG